MTAVTVSIVQAMGISAMVMHPGTNPSDEAFCFAADAERAAMTIPARTTKELAWKLCLLAEWMDSTPTVEDFRTDDEVSRAAAVIAADLARFLESQEGAL